MMKRIILLMFLVIFQKLPFLNNTTHSHYRVEITKTAIPFWSSFVLVGLSLFYEDTEEK